MDLIGKLYIDHIIHEKNLDGKSHLVKNITEGGLISIFKEKKFKDNLLSNFKFDIFLITSKQYSSLINKKFKNININFLFTKENLPYALIFENNGKRTSFVCNDEITKIDELEKKNDTACIFYGDKLKSKIFKNYKKLFIDTAGNSYNDLLTLSKIYDLPKNSIISISKEYLNSKLIENFMKSSYSLIAHCPKETVLYENKKIIKIPNSFYIKPNALKSKASITGLGDKFFLLIAFFNEYKKLSILDSILESQRIISNILADNKYFI